MKQIIRDTALLLCLVFRLAYSASNADSGVENTEMETETAYTYTTDPRWRVISGFDAARGYSYYTQLIAEREPPLVSVATSDPASQDAGLLLETMEGVCELVMFHGHVARTEAGSDLHSLLSANVEDSCHWLNYLVTSDPHVTSSSRFSSLPSSCSPEDTTRLHHYCLQLKLRNKDQLRRLVHHVISDPLHTYYGGTVHISRSHEWLQTSSIPLEQQTRIQGVI